MTDLRPIYFHEGRTDSPALRLEKNKHATTLRLLELSLENNRQMADTYGLRDDIELCAKIRAHLAAHGGGK